MGTVHSIPIYSKEARGQVLPAYNNQWLDLQRSLLQDGNRQSFLDVLEDFKIKYNQDKIIKKSTKSRVEGTNVALAQKRMLERKLNKKAVTESKHVLKQFKKNGEEHFLIVKKKIENSPDMEDIFADWKPNFVDVHEQRREAARSARKNRTRKISNRALRKELVKEIEEAENKKPMSYSDVLKKNLKAPMEDIFEAWRDYLQELDEIVRSDSRTSFCKGESVESILETAESYQQELQNCGQPTVFTTPPSKANKKLGLQKEVIFASWRHNSSNPNEVPNAFKNDAFQAENYFASWKRNFKHDLPMADSEIDPESILEDWVHNFEGPKMDKQDSNKMLKNKQRNQRRSKKNNKQQQ